MSFLFIFVTSDDINIWKKGNEKSSLPNKRFTVFLNKILRDFKPSSFSLEFSFRSFELFTILIFMQHPLTI